MRRRDALRTVGTLGAAGSLGVLAGCSGGGEQSDSESGSEESAALSAANLDYREGESGELVVTLTVKNSGEAAGTGHLYVTVTAAKTTGENETADDDQTVAGRESREVTVPAGGSKDLAIPFEFTVEQFERNGNINVDLRT